MPDAVRKVAAILLETDRGDAGAAAATALVKTVESEPDLATFGFAVAALLWAREGRPPVDSLPF